MRGHTPPPLPPLPLDRDLAVIGPMARCAADLSLLLDVIAGPDPLDTGNGYKLALPPPRHTALKDFRVLVIDTDPVMPTDEVRARHASRTLAANLAKAGVKVDAQQPAAAGFRRLVAALYADADVVPRAHPFRRRSMPARRPRPPRCRPTTPASPPSGCAASRSAIATG